MNAAMGEKNVVPSNMFLSERFYQDIHLKEENAKDLTLIISLSGSITNQLILHSSKKCKMRVSLHFLELFYLQYSI